MPRKLIALVVVPCLTGDTVMGCLPMAGGDSAPPLQLIQFTSQAITPPGANELTPLDPGALSREVHELDREHLLPGNRVGAAFMNPDRPPRDISHEKSIADYARRFVLAVDEQIAIVERSIKEAPPDEEPSLVRELSALQEARPHAMAWARELASAADPWAFLQSRFPLRSREDRWLKTIRALFGFETPVLFVEAHSWAAMTFHVPPSGARAIVTRHQGRPLRFVLVSRTLNRPAWALMAVLHELLHVKFLPEAGFESNFDFRMHEALTDWKTRDMIADAYVQGGTREAWQLRDWINEGMARRKAKIPPGKLADLDGAARWYAEYCDWYGRLSDYHREIALVDWLQDQFPSMNFDRAYETSDFEPLYRESPLLARLKEVGELIFYSPSLLHEREVWRLFDRIVKKPVLLANDAFWRAARTVVQWCHQETGRLDLAERYLSNIFEFSGMGPIPLDLEYEVAWAIFKDGLFARLVNALAGGEREEAVIAQAEARLAGLIRELLRSGPQTPREKGAPPPGRGYFTSLRLPAPDDPAPLDWHTTMRQGVQTLAKKQGIRLGEDLPRAFQEVNAVIDGHLARQEFAPYHNFWRREQIHLQLTAELLWGIAQGEEGPVRWLGSFGPKPGEPGAEHEPRYIDVLFMSSHGPAKASFEFRNLETAPLVYITLKLYGAAVHTFHQIRIGPDLVKDLVLPLDLVEILAHRWPHLQIGRAKFGIPAWTPDINLFPSTPRSMEQVPALAGRLYGEMQKLQELLSGLTRAEGASLPSCFPVIAKPVSIVDKPWPADRKLTVSERKELLAKIARAAKKSHVDFKTLEQIAAPQWQALLQRAGLTADAVLSDLKGKRLNAKQAEAVVQGLREFRLADLTRAAVKPEPPKPAAPHVPTVYLMFQIPRGPDDFPAWRRKFVEWKRQSEKPVLLIQWPGPVSSDLRRQAEKFNTTPRAFLHSPDHQSQLEAFFTGELLRARVGEAQANRVQLSDIAEMRQNNRRRRSGFNMVLNEARLTATEHKVPTLMETPILAAWIPQVESYLNDLDAQILFAQGNTPEHLERRILVAAQHRDAVRLREEPLAAQIARKVAEGHDVFVMVSPLMAGVEGRLAARGLNVVSEGPRNSTSYEERLMDDPRGPEESAADYELRILRSQISRALETFIDNSPDPADPHRRFRILTNLWDREDIEGLFHRLVSLEQPATSLEFLRTMLVVGLRPAVLGLPPDRATALCRAIADGLDDRALNRFGYFSATMDLPEHDREFPFFILSWLTQDEETVGQSWLTPDQRSHFPAIAVEEEDASPPALMPDLSPSSREAKPIAPQPEDPVAHGLRARSLFAKGDFAGALAEREIQYRLEPADSKVRDQLAAAYAEARRYEEAVALYEGAPGPMDDTRQQRIAALRKSQETFAIREAVRLAAADPVGGLERAVARLEEALRAAPHSLPLRSALARALIRAQRVEEGMARWREVLTGTPGDFETSKALHQEFPPQINLYLTQNTPEGWKQAERLARFYVELFPEHSFALALLGEVLFRSGQSPLALLVLRQALQLDERSSKGHELFARCYEKAGDLNLALEHAEKAYALSAKNKEPVRRLLVRILKALEKYSRAIELDLERLKDDPADLHVLGSLIGSYRLTKQWGLVSDYARRRADCARRLAEAA